MAPSRTLKAAALIAAAVAAAPAAANDCMFNGMDFSALTASGNDTRPYWAFDSGSNAFVFNVCGPVNQSPDANMCGASNSAAACTFDGQPPTIFNGLVATYRREDVRWSLSKNGNPTYTLANGPECDLPGGRTTQTALVVEFSCDPNTTVGYINLEEDWCSYTFDFPTSYACQE